MRKKFRFGTKGSFTKILREMYELPHYQYSVIVGLLLSDGWLIFTHIKKK